MQISNEAVEAAAKAASGPWTWGDLDAEDKAEELFAARQALAAAAPYMLAEVERELTEAKRVIALLVLEAGGKVSLSRRAVAELSNETVIETMQDVINGGWVIRASAKRA